MNASVKLTLLSIFYFTLSCNLFSQNISFEKSESFYPNSERLKKETITWGHLTVPENWETSAGHEIKIAVAVLKNTSGVRDADAVVFIQGGPGGSGVRAIWSWLNHPVREKNDVVLFDVRGTGFSEPRLCPDLGKAFLKILAKNQAEEEDAKQKTAAAMTCKQELLNKNIDLGAYHSLSIAKDLNALKTQLGYSKWHVYGISYGTYTSQVYASTFPEDITGLILDSSVADISNYYTQNTGNYMSSLSKVFDKCKDDPGCNKQYPDLENVFYKTIAALEKQPITVDVDRKLIESESFTYNAEDFKVATQQVLYNKQLIEVLPLLIYQVYEKNQDALGNLVAAFSSLLNMDYGAYYCVSCNEVLPNNKFLKFQENAAKFKNLGGGISFYGSDFEVCGKWNGKSNDSTARYHNLSNLSALSFPVLVFAGEFDPITPASNGDKVVTTFSNANLIKARTYGHAPGFTKIGKKATEAFINNPDQKPNLLVFEEAAKINFAKAIRLNGGVSTMGNSLNRLDPLFLGPLLIALFLMGIFTIVHLTKLLGGKYDLLSDKVIRGVGLLTSMTGIFCLIGFVSALTQVAKSNYFILAFGLPESYNYLFILLAVFIILILLSLLYFIIEVKKINDRSIVFSVIFSQIVFVTYFLYWGIL